MYGGTWSSPVNLSDATNDASEHQIAVDPNGNAIAIWTHSNGSNAIIQTSYCPFGGNWSIEQDLSDPGRDAHNPQIVIHPNGSVVAVWQRDSGVTSFIQARTYQYGGSWSPVVNISSAEGSSTLPRLGMDENGNVVAVWTYNDGSSNQYIQVATYTDGSWSDAVNLSATNLDAYEASLAVASNGNAVVAWRIDDGADMIIQASTYTNGGSWISPVTLSASGQDVSAAQVGINAIGNAVVV